jgi:hypothetical protein
MSKQYEVLSCPFCKKGEISCIYFPSAWSEKRTGRNSLGKGVSVSKSTDAWIVQSGCNNCGKGQEEVEKQLRKEGYA